jgi:prepilin-type processing-associated H-X9-DG protein/prepilin-type N-terminal cleavage/methylation domain-containing protein
MMYKFNKQKNPTAFTLVELLVVISVISMLLAILMPALSSARSTAWNAVCKSNLRQLLIANIGYADNNDGFYVPAASDMWNDSGLHRWHGVRKNLNSAFDPNKGPLAAYLGGGKIKNCPQKTGFLNAREWKNNFEHGCGGYGYNLTYIGSRLWQNDSDYQAAYEKTTNESELAKPGLCLMFADTAFSVQKDTYIEYSFAEPPYTVCNGRPVTGFYMSPSIHFRHRDNANIGWADGHVDQRSPVEKNQANAYGVNSVAMNLGWFAPVDNSMFDLE